MRVSQERLLALSESTGFSPQSLEKVLHLLNLLEGLQAHPFLKGRLALKGGTALNLFVFDIPRLSVDLDLNYIGAVEREAMLAERPNIENAVRSVCERENLSVRRIPEDHAGSKWRLHFHGAPGMGATLELDISYMYRVPLWPAEALDSRTIGDRRATGVPVMDIHELAAGKLVALMDRRAGRDLFDARQLLHGGNLDYERLRKAFVVYGAMRRRNWLEISMADVTFDASEVQRSLVPMIRGNPPSDIFSWAEGLVDDCLRLFDRILPYTQSEKRFLDQIQNHGRIEPELLTGDPELADRIRRHPGLEWKAKNVRAYLEQPKG